MISILGEHEPYEFPEGFDNGIRLKDLLENEVDEKFYISGEKVEKLIATLKEPLKAGGIKVSRKGEVYEGRTEIASTLMARDYKGLDNTVKTAVAVPCLTPDRVEKRQNGRRFKEDGEPMFTLTGQDRHGVLAKQATKQGYDIAYEYDSINIEQPNSKTRRGRVGRQIANTLTCGCNQAVAIVQTPRGNNKGGIKEVCPTISAHSWEDNNHLVQNLRIRKLTPLECWRLMGFDDEHFHKAQDAGISNSQLYKQAGNSIVVDVLEYIFMNLFNTEE